MAVSCLEALLFVFVSVLVVRMQFPYEMGRLFVALPGLRVPFRRKEWMLERIRIPGVRRI